jgi:Mrp family chromosome partitioning ATPase
MIVAKAVKMAELMHVPVLGLVENMAYFKCPNCQQEHKIYGESHIAEIAEKYKLPVLARIPIEPALAAACDRGAFETFEGGWLDDAVQVLQQLDESQKG